MNQDLSPLQAAARRVEAAKSSEQEIAALRARVEALESRQVAAAAAPVPPPKELSKEERIEELNRRVEASTSVQEIWDLTEEIQKIRWSGARPF